MTNNLKQSVQVYFDKLANSSDEFNRYLASTNHKDAITRNVMFDRHQAVQMILQAARKADDAFTTGAAEGDIYQCMVRLMRDRKHAVTPIDDAHRRRIERVRETGALPPPSEWPSIARNGGAI